MKLKYVTIQGRKRTAGAVITAVFLSAPFAVTLLMVLTDIDSSLRGRTWMIPLVLFAGMLACGYLYLTPQSYLLLNPETRDATYVNGGERSHFTFAAPGPILFKITVAPANPRRRQYVVETAAVPVIFHTDSLRDPALAKARELCKFLGVQGLLVDGLQPGVPIDG
jgi:hypothetical protein